MNVRSPIRGIWRFGVFEADLDAGELRKRGARIRLQEQPFQVLAVLLLREGQLVTREELRREVWPEDTFVEFDHALNTAVKKIRIALGDDACAPRYIETVPKRGYRFIAPVQAPTDLLSGAVGTVVSKIPVAKRNLSRREIAATVGACLAIALLIGVLALHRLRAVTAAEKRRVVMAVLPFDCSRDDVQQVLCDGIVQELITQLGRTDPEKLGVAARASVLPYRQTSKSLAQIGGELKADYLVEGCLRRDGQHVRVSVELIRVHDQVRIWGDDFDDEDDKNLLVLESDIAKRIATEVQSAVISRAGP